jgi:hypothetical protein
VLRQDLESPALRVLFGSYDLASRSVGLPLARTGRSTNGLRVGLFPPPGDDEGLQELAVRLARSAGTASLLRAGADAH